METLLISVLYIYILLIFTYFTKKLLRRNGFPGAYNGILVGCILYYVFIPLIFILFKDYYLEQAGDWRYSQILKFLYEPNVQFGDIMLAIGGLVIGFIGFNFGYRVKRRYIGKSEFYSRTFILDGKFIIVVRRIAYVTLAIGGISILLYINAFGGLASALQLAEVLRQHYSTLADYGISGIYSYFLMLSGVLNVTPLLFYMAWKNERRKSDKYWCIISFLLAVMYLLINSGKSAILRLAIIIFYMILHENKVKHKWVWFAVVVIFGLPIMDVLDVIFVQGDVREAIENFNYLYLAREFAVPTELNYNMNDIVNQYGYLYFQNLITDFLNILPGLHFESSFTNTSEFMRGSNWMNLGGTPNDLLTYGFLQMRYVGVIIIWMLWGMISGWIDNMIEKIQDNRGQHMIAIIACMNMFSVITCADISSTVLYNLSFILVNITLWLYNKKIKRLRNRS